MIDPVLSALVLEIINVLAVIMDTIIFLTKLHVEAVAQLDNLTILQVLIVKHVPQIVYHVRILRQAA